MGMGEALSFPCFDFSLSRLMLSSSSRVSESPAPPVPQFYTAQELAQLLRVTENTIYRMAKRGQLPFYCIGRAIRFRRRDVETYLQSVKGQTPEEEE